MTANTDPPTQTSWADFESFVTRSIPAHTVPYLKQFATILSTYGPAGIYIRSSDRKADIISKIQAAFYAIKARQDFESYRECRYWCERVGRGLGWEPIGGVGAPPSIPSASGSNTLNARISPRDYNEVATAAGPNTATFESSSGLGYGGINGVGSGFGHVDRWRSAGNSYHNGPTFGAATVASNVGSNLGSVAPRPVFNPGPQYTLQDWKSNPMWKPLRALTSIETLPDIAHNESHSTYRGKKTNLVLPNEICDKVKFSRSNPSLKPHYSIRLFCTSSDHYHPLSSIYARQPPLPSRNIPIEFPNNPEVAVNGVILPFREKGLRGKAGSAPPLDVDKSKRVTVEPGKVTGVTFGHRGPTTGKNKNQSKRFFYQVVFCETTLKEELLTRLVALEPTKPEDALAELKRKEDDDDDGIVAGTVKMSLKDPLSYMRMTKPIRSSQCSHIQCFDAQWWIESNSVHPQWLCPHCSKPLLFDDLVCDGYVLSILEACPDSVDDVLLEPGGEWHTEDNKFGSKSWLEAHAHLTPLSGLVPPPREGNGTDEQEEPESKPDINSISVSALSNVAHVPNGKTSIEIGQKRKVVEIVDSDTDDDRTHGSESRLSNAPTSSAPPFNPPSAPLVLPRLQHSRADFSRTSSASTSARGGVIDLTMSDSEEEDDRSTRQGSSQRNESMLNRKPGPSVPPPTFGPGKDHRHPSLTDALRNSSPSINVPGKDSTGNPIPAYPTSACTVVTSLQDAHSEMTNGPVNGLNAGTMGNYRPLLSRTATPAPPNSTPPPPPPPTILAHSTTNLSSNETSFNAPPAQSMSLGMSSFSGNQQEPWPLDSRNVYDLVDQRFAAFEEQNWRGWEAAEDHRQ
ncbi:hypothetical protein L204_104504 [Cryptococcus depauperatus]